MTTNGTAQQGQYRGQNAGAQRGRAATPQPNRIQDDISGAYTDLHQVADVLRRAAENYNLIGPMVFGALPEGFAVVMSVVAVDVENETYDVGFGKRGLSRIAIERIAGAAGVSTSSSVCIGMAPNYAAWSVTVGRQDLDGSVRSATKSRAMDLREGSGQLQAMREAARAKNKDPEAQIREQRLHIAAHAETKAWLRAVRTLLGLRTYTLDELKRPFAVPKLQFTGRTTDRELRLMFAKGLMTAALGGVAQLYGAGTAVSMAPQLGMGAPPPPPQLGMGGHGLDEEEDVVDEDGVVHEPPTRGAAPTSPTSSGGRASAPRREAPAPQGVHLVKVGRDKGRPVTEVEDLTWYEEYLVNAVADPSKSRWRDENQAALDAVRAELRRREEEAMAGVDQPYSDDAQGGNLGGRDPQDPNSY